MHPDSPARQEVVRQRPGVNDVIPCPQTQPSRWPQYLCLKGDPLQCELHGLNLSNVFVDVIAQFPGYVSLFWYSLEKFGHCSDPTLLTYQLKFFKTRCIVFVL